MARVERIFGKKLAAVRQKRALTQRQLGEAIGGVSDETISRLERNEVAGTLAKHLPKLAAALGMSLDEFREQIGAPEDAQFPSGLNLQRMRPAQSAPEFQIGIAASRRVDKLADHPDGNRPVATADRRAFVGPVDGDCQSPKWKHGELVIFSYDVVEREGILPGNSYYLAFTDGSSTFKRLFPDERDPDCFILRCWNRKKYPDDRKVHREEIVRIARAVAKQIVVDEGEGESG